MTKEPELVTVKWEQRVSVSGVPISIVVSGVQGSFEAVSAAVQRIVAAIRGVRDA